MKTLRSKLNSRKGVTMVELIVSVALLAVFCLCCSVLIRPCAAAFNQMQKTSRAQMIGDSIIEGLRSELMTARGTIRFAPAATGTADQTAPFAKPTDGNYNIYAGSAIEIRTTGDYFELIDAGFVPQTLDEAGVVLSGTETPTPPKKDKTAGRLHIRYFTNEGNNEYIYAKGTTTPTPVAYAYTTAYTEKFYMNNIIELNFAVQGYSQKNIDGTKYTCVNSVRVDLTVKEVDEDGNTVSTVHAQTAILDLPNAPVLVQTVDQFAPKSS